ncbi:MAG TPA: hypothetical protein VIJ94_10635 [Caulobacteraceae bacterium]
MSKLTRLILAAALLELIAVALVFPFLRWGVISENLSGVTDARRLDTIRLFVTFAAPFALLALWMVISRRLKAYANPSRAHRGYGEASLLVAAFFLMAYQAQFASQLGAGAVRAADPELQARAGAMFCGLLMAIMGNFAAKIPAPAGSPTADPGVWTKVALGYGWTMALGGLTLAVCAIVLPLHVLFPLILIGVLAIVPYAVLVDRALRPFRRAG